jgi:hypothetical protein
MITVKTLDEWRKLCPYGLWTCDGGRQVLFNRLYWPVLERGDDGVAHPSSPGEWIPWKKQEWFFDANPPWCKGREAKATLERINLILSEWGLPELSKPPRRGRGEISRHRVAPADLTPHENPWNQRLEAAHG